MGRHEQREQLFKLLFRVEFNKPEDMPEQVKLFMEENEEITVEEDALYISVNNARIQKQLLLSLKI